MPIYEYVCGDCGKEFEALVRASTTPQCPGCRSTRLEKQLSVFATANAEPAIAASPCSTCGDPRGPGACRFN
ncbi:MAG TPA: zinc ribbon domain-containing protein [Burkholderiaceae bacterium]|nr:zinc ribbon domain-containing protein [Burkholderiaceae bacterium]